MALEDEMDEEINAAIDAPLLERRIADLERQLAESEAACARMREFISERHDILHGGLDCPGEPRCLLLLVLSSTDGADLLREVTALRECERVLRDSWGRTDLRDAALAAVADARRKP